MFNIGDKVRLSDKPMWRTYSGDFEYGFVSKYANEVATVEQGIDRQHNYGLRFSDGRFLQVHKDSLSSAEIRILDTGLNRSDIEKIREYADSLRKQTPPTEDNKYIWIEEAGFDVYDEPLLFRRAVNGEYTMAQGRYVVGYDVKNIHKWRPATVS